MSNREPRVLLVAEAANPEWVSVPLVGWSHSRALAKLCATHVVTQIRNAAALEKHGWVRGREFTALDTESTAAPLFRATEWVRRTAGLGWTLTTAVGGISYYHFEHEVVRRFGADLKAGKYDIVHRLTPLSPTTPSYSLAKACEELRVPFVVGPLNGGVPWPKGYADVQRAEGEWLSYVRGAYKLLPGYRRMRSAAAALLVGSLSTWDQLRGYHHKCVYLPENAIDPERFTPPALAHAPGPLRIAFVGRLVPYKGADLLLEAAAPLLRAGKACVDVVGDGPDMPRLRALIADLGVEKHVTLAGWVAHEQLARRLGRSQVFGFPSVREFGGAVVLEAMALGLVPVVVGYAGPNELVTDATGFRIPVGPRPRLVAEFQAVLARLAEQPELLAPLREQARQRVLEHFTWDAKAKQTVEVYRWVLGQRDKPDFGMPL